jgi:hypothetical protein
MNEMRMYCEDDETKHEDCYATCNECYWGWEGVNFIEASSAHSKDSGHKITIHISWKETKDIGGD